MYQVKQCVTMEDESPTCTEMKESRKISFECSVISFNYFSFSVVRTELLLELNKIKFFTT